MDGLYVRGEVMKIGDLVIHEHNSHYGMGIVIDDSKYKVNTKSDYSMVTVHWFDGFGVGLYWTDELEVL